MAKFTINKDLEGRYSYQLMTHHGEVLLCNEGYSTRENCLRDIEEVRINAYMDRRFERKLFNLQQYYFCVTNVNKHTLGVSPVFKSQADLEHCIEQVKKFAAKASVKFKS